MEKKMKISDLMKAVHKGISDNLIGFSEDNNDYKYAINGYQSKNTAKVIAARLKISEKNGVLISTNPISVVKIMENCLVPISSRAADHLIEITSSVLSGKIAKAGESMRLNGGGKVSFGDDLGGTFNISQLNECYISTKVVNGSHINNGIHSSLKEAVFESCLLGYTTLKSLGFSNNLKNCLLIDHNGKSVNDNSSGDFSI